MELALRLGQECGHPPALIISRSDLAWVYGRMGLVAQGLVFARAAIESAAQVYPLWQPAPLAVIARLHMLDGDLAAARAAVEAAEAGLRPESIQLYSPILTAMARGELALAQGDFARVVRTMDELLADLGRMGRDALQPAARHLQGRALAALGQTDAAREILHQAVTQAEAHGARWSLWPILLSLGELEAACGAAARAQALRDRAASVIGYIAEHSPLQLRGSFLALPHVRAALV
jgi:tetratricopeptide (TPR) repeat protein